MKESAVLVLTLMSILAGENVVSGSSTEEECVSQLRQARTHLDQFLHLFASEEPQRLAAEHAAMLDRFAALQVDWMQKKNRGDTESSAKDARDGPPSILECMQPCLSIINSEENSANSAEGRQSQSQESAKSPKMTPPMPNFMGLPPEFDPFVRWISTLKKYLENEEGVCRGPKFTGLNSVTEEQLWGVISVLAVNAGQPLCTICNLIVDAIKHSLGLTGLALQPGEKVFLDTFLSLSPNSSIICQLLIPSCYTSNGTSPADPNAIHDAGQCLGCSVCKSTLIAVQNLLILNPTSQECVGCLVAWVVGEICQAVYQQNNQTDINQCVQTGTNIAGVLLRSLQKILMPDSFCNTILSTCAVNSAPNMLMCLQDYCKAALHSLPQPIQYICSLIPASNANDNSQNAANNDVFMNIKKHVEL